MLSKQFKSFVKKVLSENQDKRQTQEETVVRRPKRPEKEIVESTEDWKDGK